MKLSKGQTYLVYAIAGIAILAFVTIQFGFSEVLMASFEGEESEDEVWTNLNVEYRVSMDAPMAIVTVDFHNNKMFETFDDYDGDIYHATYNFTSFDFRLRSAEETPAYPAGLRSYSEDDVELLRGESYSVDFHVRDLVENEPIKVEITAMGYEEGGRRKTIEEKVPLTLQPPASSQPEEETPGFTLVFAIFAILSAMYVIVRKKR